MRKIVAADEEGFEAFDEMQVVSENLDSLLFAALRSRVQHVDKSKWVYVGKTVQVEELNRVFVYKLEPLMVTVP